MDRDDMEVKLFDAAQTYARRKKVRFGPGADQDIRHYARKAAAEIAPGPADQHLARVNAATLSFERLVDQMIAQSKSIVGYRAQNPGIIGEETLREALKILCPLWPFC